MLKNVSPEVLAALREDLDHFARVRDRAIKADDPDVFCVHSEQYHRTADRMFKLSGHDPRLEG